MEALINAGGKGTRMGPSGIEKPMQIIGGEPVIHRVLSAVRAAAGISRVLVSVSSNTQETERYLQGLGVETIRTSGNDFMGDLHEAFAVMQGKFVFTCPSDLPLLTTPDVTMALEAFDPKWMQSMIVLVDAATVRSMGVKPSYLQELDGRSWVLSGLSVMDRERTLAGEYLEESYCRTESQTLALNVNTLDELALARSLF